MACCWRWCHRTCTCCLSEEERKSIAVDREIKKILRQHKKKERKEIKILLLGTGESGKTTFIKQMRIIHGSGYSEEDRRAFTKLVFQNIFTAVKAMTNAMTTLKIPYDNPDNQVLAQRLQEADTLQLTKLDRRHVDAIQRLWADSGLKLCYSRRREYQLLDSTEYFMANLGRMAAHEYIPTDQDVLRVRVPTTGINDYSFTVDKISLRIVDVGGQKSERRKWIHCFENVTSLIFLASLSEYDQVLEEKDTDNRMEESMALFYTTIHSPWFLRASVILFLNKKDILADKIRTSDLHTYFPSFTGQRQDPLAAMNFIERMYIQQAVNRENKDEKNKTVYPHFTCATDTQNIRKVFSDIKDTVLIKSLEEYYLL
ncbi:guanine nucleotide-binding protein subunit alpha-14-like [Paramormyrops kingsleyae]|uniref:Guanine nucleotide-binding protein subunit alpha n=1 Tax=Paramormyrops kingsleyae TaxID=1676925 RepID=A0A3B3T861_9TELE|nr:guanine nucleotide-binding protein subunit alpha-11-like [Paramormyrops kingsleyae]